MTSDIEELHERACARGDDTYVDPGTGLHVFTAVRLRRRPCCGCGCRHCPYRAGAEGGPAPGAQMLHGDLDDLPDSVDALFWSGGKDSFLALRALQREGLRPVLLVTTYAAGTGAVGHQGVRVELIARQAAALELPALGVPLVGDAAGYTESVQAALRKVVRAGVDVQRAAFGDLHLEGIRRWREEHLAGVAPKLCYPVWKRPYEDLMLELERTGFVVRVSAVDPDAAGAGYVRVGDIFGRDLWEKLPDDVDRFGENGEFHTAVELWNPPVPMVRRGDGGG